MGSLYISTPHNTSAPFAPVEVATSAAAKSVLQVAVPSTTDIRILGWGISFDGVTPTDPAGIVELFDCTASTLATVTALSPDKFRSSTAPASLCVSGTTATGYNATAEGTLTAYRPLDIQEVHPQTGYSLWFPQGGTGPGIDASHQIRIRTTFSVTINCIPWVVWEEPS